MRRPQAVSRDALVDADACARAGSAFERRFLTADLLRLRDAGVLAGSAVEACFQFSCFGGEPVIDGNLRGTVVLTCQRCMEALPVTLDEHFQVVIVREERTQEQGGYEPLVADPSRFDLRWLAEEQALLALPLVPLHEPGECTQVEAAPPDDGDAEDRDGREGGDEAAAQKPFRNLRDMLRRG